MQLSRRFGNPGENDIARVRAELRTAGANLTDLTDSNPTHHGLLDPAVLEAVARSAAKAANYNPDPRGPLPAREALAARFGGKPDNYWLTASTSEAYSWLFTALTDPGDAIAVPAPGYPLLESLAQLAQLGAKSHPIHYVHTHGWVYDLAAFQALLSPGKPGELPKQTPRACVIVNPGNPTGAYVPQSALDDIVATCARVHAALIADEVFGPFALAKEAYTTFAGEDRTLTFTLDGLSKLLCAPQLKLGWIRVSGPA
ncbi:MAG: pyridoxal phosphate-dependent aminotransferase, partial [Propionibacteriaceae bacterium]|nr:pyridoxal phosphate-dependent aminotransferase [Propionibacteriaceae bacterium]